MRRLKLRKQCNKVKLLLYSCFYFLYIKPLPAFLLCIVKLYRKLFHGIEFIAHISSTATCFVMRHNLSYIYYILFFELLSHSHYIKTSWRRKKYSKIGYQVLTSFVRRRLAIDRKTFTYSIEYIHLLCLYISVLLEIIYLDKTNFQ